MAVSRIAGLGSRYIIPRLTHGPYMIHAFLNSPALILSGFTGVHLPVNIINDIMFYFLFEFNAFIHFLQRISSHNEINENLYFTKAWCGLK